MLIMFIAMPTHSILVTSVRVFLANLNAFSVFFSCSPQRVSCLDDCVAMRIPWSVQTNFQSRIISKVFEHKDDLMKCFELIIDTWKRDQVCVHEASVLLHWLQDRAFSINLENFHQLMPHVDILYAQLQKCHMSSMFIQTYLKKVVKSINNVIKFGLKWKINLCMLLLTLYKSPGSLVS